MLDELGLDAFVKTSGGKGLHLVVPLAQRDGWDTIKAFAKAIAQFMAQQLPERFTATSGPKNRVGKIFIDYLRNARGASTVAAYSVRARPGLPVSVPVSREELEHVRGAQQWTVANLQQRLQALKDDPWAGYANRQKISKKMWDKLGARPRSKGRPSQVSDQDKNQRQCREDRPLLQVVAHAVALFQLFAAQAEFCTAG